MIRSLEAERSVRVSELFLLLHHRAAPEPLVPHGIWTPLHRPLLRTVAELIIVAEGIVETLPASSSSSTSRSIGTELRRGGEAAALIQTAAATPRKALRRSNL